MSAQILQLNNSIKVIVEEMPYLKSVTFGLYVVSGSGNETKENNGIAHAIEHMIFKGTPKYSAYELAKIMTDLGGGINAYTSKETTVFYGKVLTEDFPFAVELLAEMLKNPRFSASDFAKEKHVIIDEINSYEDSAEDSCHEILLKEVWKDNPLGFIISGSKSNVRHFTRDDLVAFMKDNYTADNIVISVAGAVKSCEVKALFERCFGFLQPGGKKLIPAVPTFHQVFVARKRDTEQLHLNIAFPGVGNQSDDRYAMYLLNSHIGGNLDSLLFQKIREENGLTYNVYSYTNMSDEAGLFHIYASMDGEQVMHTLSLIYGIIEDLRKNGISSSILEKLKKQIRPELVLGSESANNTVLTNARSFISNGRVISTEQALEAYMNVTLEDINRVLKECIDTANCSMCLIGDLTNAEISQARSFWKKQLNKK